MPEAQFRTIPYLQQAANLSANVSPEIVQQIGYGSDAAIRPLLGDDFVRYQAAGAPADDDMCYYDRADDYCSTAYWYQTLPTRPFPPLPGREARLADLSLDQDAGAARNDG